MSGCDLKDRSDPENGQIKEDKVSLIVSGSDEDETMEKLKEIVTSQLL